MLLRLQPVRPLPAPGPVLALLPLLLQLLVLLRPVVQARSLKVLPLRRLALVEQSEQETFRTNDPRVIPPEADRTGIPAPDDRICAQIPSRVRSCLGQSNLLRQRRLVRAEHR